MPNQRFSAKESGESENISIGAFDVSSQEVENRGDANSLLQQRPIRTERTAQAVGDAREASTKFQSELEAISSEFGATIKNDSSRADGGHGIEEGRAGVKAGAGGEIVLSIGNGFAENNFQDVAGNLEAFQKRLNDVALEETVHMAQLAHLRNEWESSGKPVD